MGFERREFERITSRIVGNYSIGSAEEARLKNNLLFTKDISLRGAKVVAHMNIKPGESFALILHLPTCFLPILATSKVSWMKDVEASKCKIPNIKEAGVEFVKMDPLDEAKLKEFIFNVALTQCSSG